MKRIKLFEEFLNELEFKDVESFNSYKSKLKRGMNASTKVSIAGKETTVGDIEKSSSDKKNKPAPDVSKAAEVFKSEKIDPSNNRKLAQFIHDNHKMITGKKFVPEEESDFNDAVYDFIEKVTGKDAKEWSKDNYDDFNGEFADYAADNTDSSQEVNNPKRKISKKEAERLKKEEEAKKKQEVIDKAVDKLDVDDEQKEQLKKSAFNSDTSNKYNAYTITKTLYQKVLNNKDDDFEDFRDGDNLNPKVETFLKKVLGKSSKDLPEDYLDILISNLKYVQDMDKSTRHLY
jgi:hypothetical protein